MTLDTRLTELIAIGAAVAANCVACLEHHVRTSRAAGLDPEEIAAALEVGQAVRRGAAAALQRAATNLGVGAAAPPAEAVRGCGCA